MTQTPPIIRKTHELIAAHGHSAVELAERRAALFRRRKENGVAAYWMRVAFSARTILLSAEEISRLKRAPRFWPRRHVSFDSTQIRPD